MNQSSAPTSSGNSLCSLSSFNSDALMSVLPLPDELMIHILDYLSPKELGKCGLACKQLKILSDDWSLWKSLFNSTFSDISSKICRDGFEKDDKRAYREGYLIKKTEQKNCSLRYFSPSFNGEVFCGRINEAVFAASKISGEIEIWDLKTGELHTYLGHKGSISSITGSNVQIVSGFTDGTIEVWDAATGERTHTLSGHLNAVSSLTIAEGNLLSGSTNGEIKIWRMEDGECTRTLSGHASTITALTAQGGKFCSGSENGEVKIWEIENAQCLHSIAAHTRAVGRLEISDKKLTSSSPNEQTTKIWDMDKGCWVKTIEGEQAFHKFMASEGWKEIVACPLPLGKQIIIVSDSTASNDVILEEIVHDFLEVNPALAESRFKNLPQHEQNGVFAELYEILRPFKHDYFRCAEHAFFNINGQSSALQQKVQAIRNHLCRKLVPLFESDDYDQKVAMERFLRMPSEMREGIYEELDQILESSPQDDSRCAEYAFHNLHGRNATPQERAKAILNYLGRRLK